ncbi:MAG: valine--tRNA ligase [Clostridiales bacterium]|jgi:valyl-tRNA synthetase|nr:valine--tRNA ligase [Clostridiales bacterium]
MKKEMEKNYNPGIESGIYARWLEKGYFHAEVDESRTPYVIMMPPANITGQLHVGHSFTFTIQDALIRFKRMQGFNAMWLPGTDHASISTEVKIVDALAKEGLTKADLGREKFLERAWQWKDEFGGTIVRQLKLMGVSCDWDRERFTMDEGLSNAVLETFLHLYKKGLVYRGEKLINWCPKCQTTISDAEVEHEEKDGMLYYFKYPVQGGGFIEFATTRPETMLGDTAIALHPTDERLKEFAGKTAHVPPVDRDIPIIADSYVDPKYGTGAVKITPAHDPNDFAVGERHNLERINILNDDGTLNENAGAYAGMDRLEARKKITQEFKDLGLFIKTEPIKHNVGTHDRCHEVMEPMIKLQWFVKMEELAKPALDVYTSGKLRIFPERFGKVYTHWLTGIRDWCISRQLWWGHRIPVYYCDECGTMQAALETPKACPNCSCTSFTQDPDTLDTWFSSALWPFSTLGWPEKTKELEYFYPGDVLVTGYEILFFWVIRMVFSGIELVGEQPFKDIMLNGIVRDSQGRKMSKSLGNGVDPIEVIGNWGADALRLMLVTGNALESDTRFYWERLETSRNFLNKLWNASRFLLMNMDIQPDQPGELTPMDRWILSRLGKVAQDVTDRIDAYDLGMAAQMIYDFVWDEFCDWYIEMVKPRLYNQEDPSRPAALWTLKRVLSDSLRILHPFVPFVTEEIFLSIQDKEETIMLSEWPACGDALSSPKDEALVELLKDAVKGVRNTRLEMAVPPSKKVKIVLVTENPETREFFEGAKKALGILAGAKDVSIQSDKSGIGDDAVSVVIASATVFMPLEEMIDRAKEIERLEKEKKRLLKELDRANTKLSNQGFVAKAPKELLDAEKDKLAKHQEMLAKVESELAGFAK